MTTAATYILAGDVGGTNTRLSLCRLEGDTPVAERTEWLPSAGSTLEARVHEFLGKGTITVNEEDRTEHWLGDYVSQGQFATAGHGLHRHLSSARI